MQLLKKFLTLLLLLLYSAIPILGITIPNARAQNSSSVTTFSLTNLKLESGESGLVEARIDCGNDVCYGLVFEMTYDPSIVQINSVAIGSYFGENTFVIENEIDATAGTVNISATASEPA